ncbi:MAG: hypothetical protein K1Y02_06335 [Candidatus Hydrogenedentes bacterium]|nr:hypothetical protein [Candidatus Hydrogenedentota bacterium]
MKKMIAVATCLLLWSSLAHAGARRTEDLEAGFVRPPDSAKPWVYWWWLNGNVTKDGITADLSEMKRQGINGVLIFNAGGGEGPAGPKFLSPEWHELFKFALREADRLHMEVSINLCDGWDAGGPWISADCANKKLVYSELQIEGPGLIERTLPAPPQLDGYYHDCMVVAFPEKPDRPLSPQSVSASSTLGGYCDEWNFPPDDAVDNDPATYWSSGKESPTPEKPAWLALQYSEPLTAVAAYVLSPQQGAPGICEVQVGLDANQYSTIARVSVKPGEVCRVEFPEVHASRFRLVIPSASGIPVQISEFAVLRKTDVAAPRQGIKWWPFKSGNRSFWDYPRQGPAVLSEEYPDTGESDCRKADVVDLTANVNEQGQLRWDAPAGRWTVLRFGYTVVGQRTRCGTTVVGYESDMLSAKGIETHFAATALPLMADAKEVRAKSLKYLHIDSYEVGADVRGQQPTWVEDFREQFQARRGYDLLPYLPAMARRIVDNREITNRFLWDFRRTIGDLIAQRFFGRFAELGHEHGMQVHSETGYGTYPWPHIDGLECAGKNDITMGEFWIGTDIMSQFNPWGNVIKTVSSSAHAYGRSIVQAEAFTSWNHWLEYPASLKPVGDEAFCNGLNRMVFHQYTHQPRLDIKPGYQYGAGTHFDRNITWWEQSRAFFNYLGRCQYMLQRGKPFADICWFYGEGVTTFAPSQEFTKPLIPQGYDFDAVNADILMHRMSVQNGRLSIPDGPTYRAMVIAEGAQLSPALLQRIKELIQAGAVVIGSRPDNCPGLSDYPVCDQEVDELVHDIWGESNGTSDPKLNLGAGTVMCGRSVNEVLQELSIHPDFEASNEGKPIFIRYIHRTMPEAEAYFLANSTDQWFRGDCKFRVIERLPEQWDPVSGSTKSFQSFQQDGHRTIVPLELAPYASTFVVFRRNIPSAQNGTQDTNITHVQLSQTITGPWSVDFDPAWGGPQGLEFRDLIDWTQHPDPGIRFYSGKAVYRAHFDCAEKPRSGKRVYLDLGDVKYIAEVKLNRKNLGIVWTAPWRVDVTDAIKTKGNLLEITVVNLWPNRIIGDASLPQAEQRTVTNVRFPSDRPLQQSGLLGPVVLMTEQ